MARDHVSDARNDIRLQGNAVRAAAVRVARGLDVVVPLMHFFVEAREIFWMIREVTVHKQHVIVVAVNGKSHACFERGAVSLVVLVMQKINVRARVARKGLNDLCRSIGGPVVDDHNVRFGKIAYKRQKRLQTSRGHTLLVVHRDDNAHGHTRR